MQLMPFTIEQAENALIAFSEKWDAKYPAISRSWTNNWHNIVSLFAFPQEIRKIIYTTNAIESLNSVIRKSINNRKIFPNESQATLVVASPHIRGSRISNILLIISIRISLTFSTVIKRRFTYFRSS